VSAGYAPPLQVVGYISTRPGDVERGPLVRMNAQEAALRMLTDGELVWVKGPRRQELAPLEVDDSLPRGGAVVRDVAGVSASEIIRVVKPDLDRPGPGSSDRLA
jgi:anaerobic selenocysteine-containing dehydrogenase